MSSEQLRMDAMARERIVSDLDTSFLVEAGAGSGKTTSLVARILALLTSGKAEMSHIAAITFTNKAAVELQGRLRIQLERQLRSTANEAVRARLETALAHIAECFVGTIHSFCGRLLRERPMEAGLDPKFQEIDETELELRLKHYWDDYLMVLRERGDEASLQQLTDLGVNVGDLRDVFLKVAKYEDVHIFTQAAERPDFDRIRATLLPLLDETASHMPTNRPSDGWDSLQQAVRTAKSALRSWNLEHDLHVMELAVLFDKNLTVIQKRWPDGKQAKELKERFAEWRTSILHPFLESWREYLHPKLVDFVQPAVEYSRRRRVGESILSFQDLLMKATGMLRERPEVRRYFSNRYTRLFVDEFQDTDPVQAEMMLLLTGSNPNEDDWRKQEPKPGSLFIVGDPKQSIYRFRRADISTYNFVKRVIARSGDVLQLTRNFRSVRAVGDFVNYAFESKFLPPGRGEDHQASYVKMLTSRDNPKGKGVFSGVWTMTTPKMDYDRKSSIALYDAERTARWIAWACKGNLTIADREDGRDVVRPARPDDFLILLRYRAFIGLYAEQLERYRIPSETSGSQVMYEELKALYMLAACLNDPTDRIPLLSVLRGMLFGIDDEALYVYTKEIGRISLFAAEADLSLMSAEARKVSGVLERLKTYGTWVRQEPALTALIRMVEDLGLLPYAAVQPTGAIRSGTIVKVLEMLGAKAQPLANWHELTLRLQDIVKANGVEGASLFTGSGHAVRIMNVHKAKGLEAPIVVMACPCRDQDKDATEHIDRMSEPAQGYFAITRQKDTYNKEIVAQPIGWTALAEKERTYVHAERDRLLYVAATRAKQMLIVSRYPSKPAIDPWSELSVALKVQPELDDISIAPPESERYTEPWDLEGALQEWKQRKRQADQATYSVTSVTALAKGGEDGSGLTRSKEGRGAVFGTVVHRCLEALGNGLERLKLEPFLRMASEEEGLDSKWSDDARSMVNAVVEGAIWKRAMAAKQRFHEFTFTVSDSINGQDQILNGVIDLVFEEEDGWVIIDFKTDAFEAQHTDAFVRFYEPQVAAYVERWEQWVGGKVKEAGLLFLHCNQYSRIKPETYVP